MKQLKVNTKMDLDNLLKNAGIIDKDSVNKKQNNTMVESKKVTNDPSLLESEHIFEAYDGSQIIYKKDTNEYFDCEYGIKLSENDPRIRFNNLEKDYESFKETAAGTLTRQNTTADVKKGTLKKMGDRLGFDITDGGIPPKISKDSWKKD